jgi:hypothetical protein
MTQKVALGTALLGLCMTVAACSSGDSTGAHVASIKRARTSTTPSDAGASPAAPDPKLVQDAQAVASHLCSLTSDQSALEQLAPTVTPESQTLSQLVTQANDGDLVCSSQLSSQSSSLSSNADALDRAAQTMSTDFTQLNSAETTYQTLERTEPLDRSRTRRGQRTGGGSSWVPLERGLGA